MVSAIASRKPETLKPARETGVLEPRPAESMPKERAVPAGAGLRASMRRFVWRFRVMLLRRLSSSLTRRIVFLNIAGLLALFLGFLWLNQTRLGVIDARSQSLSLQAEIISAAVANAALAGADPLELDPEKLLQQQLNDALPREESPSLWFEFSINPAQVAPVLRRLVTPTRTRARIYDQDGSLLLDTRAFYRPGDFVEVRPAIAEDEEQTLFTRTWNAVKQRLGKISFTPTDDTPGPRQYLEVQRALQGNASTVVRVSTEGQTTVYAGSPIQRGGVVRGALQLSTQEGDVDRIIDEERWDFIFVFLIASGVMLVLSVLLAGTIAEPVRRLSEAADRVRRGTNARHEIPDFSARSDEIGQLSASLRDMTESLYSRIEAIERFAADVAHELKNPLTSLRSAVETLPLARTSESKARLHEVIVHDVKRLDRLITDISGASRLDAELQRSDSDLVDIASLLETIIGMRKDVLRKDEAGLELAVDAGAGRNLFARGNDSRLVQVFDNLIENALSFSPQGTLVQVRCRRDGLMIEVSVEDDGPGIPDAALERIFERFYTDRPDQGFGQHSGLGLSISRQIVEAYGGTLRAENRKQENEQVHGARFVVRLPAARGP